MTSDEILDITVLGIETPQDRPGATERGYPVSGVLYASSLDTGQITASVIVEDTGEPMPLGFLRLERGGYRLGLELTPEIIDALMNHLCDAANVMENTCETRR